MDSFQLVKWKNFPGEFLEFEFLSKLNSLEWQHEVKPAFKGAAFCFQ